MSMLFDVGEKRKGKKKKRRVEAPVAKQEFVPAPAAKAILEWVEVPRLVCDSGAPEPFRKGEICDCDRFDVVARAPKVLVWGSKPVDAMRCECGWCGTGYWVRVPDGFLPEPTGGDFKFREGVFKGKTVEQVLDLKGGKAYLEYIAAGGGKISPTASEACRKFLSTTGE